MVAVLAAQARDQVKNDREVGRDDDHAGRPHPVKQLVELEGQEGGGRDHREVLGPVSPQEQADPLGEEDCGEDEGAEPDRAQRARRQRQRGGDGAVDPVVARVQVQVGDPAGDRVGRVVAGQIERGYSRGDQGQPLDELEGPDQQQQPTAARQT